MDDEAKLIELEPKDIAKQDFVIAAEPKPNNPPWSSFEAISIWIASVLLILLVPAIFLLPYLAFRAKDISDPEQLTNFATSDPAAIVLQILAIVPAHLLTILLIWFVVTRWKKYGFLKMLGWEKGPFVWWHYILILGGFFVFAAVVGYFIPEQENDLIRILKSSKYAVFVVAFIATFTAPLVEEMVYRGVLYSAFQRSLGIPAAFLLVTFLFAVVHVPQYYPSFSTIFLLTLLSMILTWVRVVSGNLLPCVILHALFNGIQSAILIIQPYVEKPEAVVPPL